MDYRKFNIGRNVKVIGTVERVKEGSNCFLTRHETNFEGKIVGLKRFYLGTLESYGTYDYTEAPNSRYLKVEKTVVCLKVVRGMFNKPVYVLEGDIRPAEKCTACTKFPALYQDKHVWTERDKQDLREYMKDVPRDSRGRWVKT